MQDLSSLRHTCDRLLNRLRRLGTVLCQFLKLCPDVQQVPNDFDPLQCITQIGRWLWLLTGQRFELSTKLRHLAPQVR